MMREADDLLSAGRRLSGRFFEPQPERELRPGLLFVHGLNSSQTGYQSRAQSVTERLGAICLTFDLGGHGESKGDLDYLSPGDHLMDCEVAFDALTHHAQVDPTRVGVCGASYGGYLSALLAGRRDVTRFLLRAPALHGDAALNIPLGRRSDPDADASAQQLFEGLARSRAAVLVLESECDEVIPHSVIEAYLRGCPRARHEILAGAEHALTNPTWQAAFVEAVLRWFSNL